MASVPGSFTVMGLIPGGVSQTNPFLFKWHMVVAFTTATESKPGQDYLLYLCGNGGTEKLLDKPPVVPWIWLIPEDLCVGGLVPRVLVLESDGARYGGLHL